MSTHAQTPTDSPSPAPAPLAVAVSPVATDSGAAAVGVQPVSPAPTTAPPVPAPVATDSAPARAVGWKDGTYSGWGTSRHGDVEATVIIENGRITAAAISRCLTRYSCSWIAHLQPQVVERQSPEVDNVSGATESANAFYYAVVEALKAAKR
ncbi:FMN-binding protein [Gemmatimonas sp.]